jgi:hypothetical protein
MTTHYHWHACQDGNGWANLDIAALSGECGYCRVGSGASCTKAILALESSVGGTEVHIHLSSLKIRAVLYVFPVPYLCVPFNGTPYLITRVPMYRKRKADAG